MSDTKDKLIEGEFLGHAACPCGESSDACAIYKKEDEHGTEKIDGFCWSCNEYVSPEKIAEAGGVKSISKKKMSPEEEERIMKEISEKEFRGWKDRKINKQTSEFYGVRCDMSDEPGEPAVRYYPVFKEVDNSDQLVGYKKRTVEGKRFSVIGKCNNTCKLFGQNLFQAGGKFLVITGGEEDAMAVFQTLRNQDKGFITPVVSPTCGETAASVQVKSNYEYVTSFEKVIIMMDNDDVGNKAAEAIARLLKPGQAYIAKLRRKDPCDHLKEGEVGEIRQAFWKAEKFCPAGIVKLSQMWSAFENESNNEMIPFPPAFGKLNEMMAGGMERGEITTLGALTSIGKSTYVAHVVYHLLKHTDLKVGAMYLEGTQREVVRDLLSIDIRQNLRKVPKDKLNMPALRKDFFDGIASDDNFVFVDHQGALNADDMFEKLTFLAKAESCDVIIVDPIQAAVPSDNNGAVIDFMDRLLKLAKNTNCAILDVSHMRKPESKDPHDVDEYDLLGSSAINQISFNTILLSRDKMSDDNEIKNSTLVQLVKCRRTGETGRAGWVRFDNNTCMIYERDDPYEGAGLRKLENEEYGETQSGNHFEEEGSPVEADDSFDGMK